METKNITAVITKKAWVQPSVTQIKKNIILAKHTGSLDTKAGSVFTRS